jgi:hypothetical protein
VIDKGSELCDISAQFDVFGALKAGRMALHGTELTRWLRRL